MPESSSLESITTSAAALAYYDQLEPVDPAFMIGRWRGQELPTGHPMDGVLEASYWYGKVFESEEAVHPLVFISLTGKRVNVNPKWAPLGLADHLPKSLRGIGGKLLRLFLPLISTRKPTATLQTLESRGKPTATMVYNDRPIRDSFRKIDDNRVMGLMDREGDSLPFFFMLERENSGIPANLPGPC